MRKIKNPKIKKILKSIFKPYFKILAMHLIVFYQKNLSHHTCLYTPTCSEYTKRAINNQGFLFGVVLGIWRLMRCNPLSKGGYDPAPENYFKVKWVL